MQKLPNQEVLYENIIGVSNGQNTREYNKLEKLVNLGIKKQDLIDQEDNLAYVETS